MSNADTRQAIATALSTVSGVTGYPARPDALSEGDGWPQWRGAATHAYAFENTWAVLVVLPAGDVSADAFADSHGESLVDALRPIMFVDNIAPATLDTEAGQMYALLISGRSE
ncbi:MAG TPA: hypothetical protein VFM50_02850 [Nocardioidaceae bacterium]|nr:hypothetical protein [Nocardioidaceae bacterium]